MEETVLYLDLGGCLSVSVIGDLPSESILLQNNGLQKEFLGRDGERRFLR